PRNRLAALDVLVVDAAGTLADVRADCRSGDRAADGRHRLAGSAADLVTEHAAQHAADDRTGNIELRLLDDLLPLDSAALLGWTDNRTYVRNRDLEELLLGTPAVFVRRGDRCGRRHDVEVRHFVALHGPRRRNPVVHVVDSQRWIVARNEHDALAS